MNANEDTVEVVHWYIEDGAPIKKGEDLVDIATSKATITLESPASGYVRHLRGVCEDVTVEEPVAAVFDQRSEASAFRVEHQARDTRAAFSTTRLSRAARQTMAKAGIAEDQLSGEGLITSRALLRSEKPSRAKRAEVEALSIGRMGVLEASHTVQFQAVGLLKLLRDQRVFTGSPLPVILFELSRLVKNFPKLTAFWHDDRIHYYDQVNLGIALDLGKGLKILTIRNADQLTPAALHEALVGYSLKYLNNELTLDELGGSTVSVSDLSSKGILHHRPLLNRRQSLTLGIGGDRSLPGQPMTITATFDHRVATGAEVADFLNELKTNILGFRMKAGVKP